MAQLDAKALLLWIFLVFQFGQGVKVLAQLWNNFEVYVFKIFFKE